MLVRLILGLFPVLKCDYPSVCLVSVTVLAETIISSHFSGFPLTQDGGQESPQYQQGNDSDQSHLHVLEFWYATTNSM